MDVFVLGSYVNAHSMTVKQLPKAGESVQANALWTEHGGKGLNLALGMHRLGVPTQTLFAVGHDAPGHALCELLHSEGMATQGVIQLPVSSGFGIGLVAADGSNTIAVYPGANAQLTAEHIQSASQRLRECRIVCAQFEIPDAPIQKAFQQAQQHGIRTLLNPSPWRVPDPTVFALTDILVLNATEASAFFGIEDTPSLSIAQWLDLLPTLGWQGELLVVTLAEHGCVALQREHSTIHEPAWTIAVLDPTGAGDAFTSGLVYALLLDYPLKDALRFANACGAIVAAQQGVLPVLPTRLAVLDFMAEQARADSSSA